MPVHLISKMSSSRTLPKEVFIDAVHLWALERLYLDLKKVKQKELSETEKACLRGLLCGDNPNEIATMLLYSRQGLRVELSRGLYRYIEVVTQTKVNNWAKVSVLLERAGYRKQPSPITSNEPQS